MRTDRTIGVYGQTVQLPNAIPNLFNQVTPGGIDVEPLPTVPPLAPPTPPGGPSQFSIEVWFKLTTYAGDFNYPLLNKIDPSLLFGYGAMMWSHSGTYDAITLGEDHLGGTASFWDLAGHSPDGSWHYLAFTTDQTDQWAYFDVTTTNRVDASLTNSGIANTKPLLIGYEPADSDPASVGGGFLDGAICRVAFYRDTVLTADQIAAHYAASGAGYDAAILAETGLTSYWPLNETSGTVAHDSAGSNDGTYTGGVTLAAAGPDGSNAVLLDGSSGYITVPDSPSLNP